MESKTTRSSFCPTPRGDPMLEVRADVDTTSAFEQIDLLLGSVESALHTLSLLEETPPEALYGLAFTVSTARALASAVNDGVYLAAEGGQQ